MAPNVQRGRRLRNWEDSAMLLPGDHLCMFCPDTGRIVASMIASIEDALEMEQPFIVVAGETVRNGVSSELVGICDGSQFSEFAAEHFGIPFSDGSVADRPSLLPCLMPAIEARADREFGLRLLLDFSTVNCAADATAIVDFEQRLNHMLQNTGAVAVCFYLRPALSTSLHLQLLDMHNLFMTDRQVFRACGTLIGDPLDN